MPTLVIQIPDMPPVEHVLKEEAMTIGRMKGNSIALDHSSVSLSHAKLTRIGGDYFLKDLNSTNGTMLNGQSITEARLRDGDHVKFGEVMGRYHASSATLPAQTGAPPAPGLPPTVAAAPAPAPALMPPNRPKQSVASGAAAPPKAQAFTARTSPLRIQKLVIPIMAGVVGLAGVGLLVWKFAGSSAPVAAPQAAPPIAQVPAKIPPPETPAAPVPVPTAVEPAPAEPAPKQDVPSLIQALKSSDPAERRRAASALNAMGPDALGAEAKDAVPALRDALNDTDPEVRTWSALCLIHNKVYDKATVPILLQLLHHENPIMRQVACLSLALIPYEDAEKAPVIAALTDCVNQDDNAEVRNAAASALKAITPDMGK